VHDVGDLTLRAHAPDPLSLVESSTQTELPFTGLNRPSGVAVDAAGSVYVADYGNKRVVKSPTS
jgi:DNA-binding beta-propeller fold protein YncE